MVTRANYRKPKTEKQQFLLWKINIPRVLHQKMSQDFLHPRQNSQAFLNPRATKHDRMLPDGEPQKTVQARPKTMQVAEMKKERATRIASGRC